MTPSLGLTYLNTLINERIPTMQTITPESIRDNPHAEYHFMGCARHIGPRGGMTETIERWRTNGAVQTWKRDPSRFRLPIKHGLYDYSEITDETADRFHFATDCPLSERG
jgi:hypothetical protein